MQINNLCIINDDPNIKLNHNNTIKNIFLPFYADELWKLTRMPHVKKMDATKIDQAIAKYDLEKTPFLHFNNTEDTCRINSGSPLSPASLILTSAAALTLFRRLY